MAKADGELKSLIINGEPYLVQEAVFELVMAVCKERDTYAQAFQKQQEEKK